MENTFAHLIRQIDRIKDKFSRLKEKDQDLEIFGAEEHRYKMNPTLDNETIVDFEQIYTIKLPREYVLFLKEIGNGGAGPFYGVVSLQNSIYEDLDKPNKDRQINPALPFPYTEHWNINLENSKDDENLEKEYFSSTHSNGLIRICNYGCGIFINLVVNGSEYGNVWTDDRCNDGGIYPSIELGNSEKLTFLDWYELWIDESLKELEI